VLVTASLSVDSSSKIDIKDNGIVVDYTSTSPLSSIASSIASAYNNGSWNGNGITSSLAAAARTTSTKTGVGYGEASVVGRTDLFGQSVDSTAVLVKYTYYGDANLDGVVDSVDFNIQAANWGAEGIGWSEGDFNYDGTIDTIDFNKLVANYGKDGLTGAPPAFSGALVPEPMALAIPFLGGGLLVRRRRR
jgi:hypothetical protein